MKYPFVVLIVYILICACSSNAPVKNVPAPDPVISKYNSFVKPSALVTAHRNISDTIVCDTVIAGITAKFHIRIYSGDSVLNEEKFDDGSFSPFSVVLDRTYFPNGKLESETIGERSCCTGPEWDREFDENGNKVYVGHETDLEPSPDDHSEFNHPMLFHEQNYEKGQLVNEGDTYTNCGECEFDSVGTWKFYSNGKLIRKKIFTSWQELYKASGGILSDNQHSK